MNLVEDAVLLPPKVRWHTRSPTTHGTKKPMDSVRKLDRVNVGQLLGAVAGIRLGVEHSSEARIPNPQIVKQRNLIFPWGRPIDDRMTDRPDAAR